MVTVFKAPRFRKHANPPGFALVVTLSLMILLAVISVGMLGLASVELRKTSSQDARSAAMANARLALMLAVGQLQKELGDDRRITADASVLANSKNPYSVGVWNSWSPDLASKTGSGSTPRVDYRGPKSQTGFRNWLVSSADPDATKQLTWHSAERPDSVALFDEDTSGFDLRGQKIPVSQGKLAGAIAWAVTQENTKARLNVSGDDSLRLSQGDRLQAPTRPNLSNSAYLKHPADENWSRRAASVCRLSQVVLDPAYGASRTSSSTASKDYTTDSYSLLTNTVRGGVKADLNTGFELSDADFNQDSWSDAWGNLTNPFRSNAISQYSGQKALYRPVNNSAQATVQMQFEPASVKHKFNVNGAPTFDMLRSYYRTYRHLYSTSSGDTAFERLYSHIAVPAADKVAGRPFGEKTQPSLAPVLDRMNMVFSIFAKPDGTLCILLSPFVTIWNPYNVAIETEGLVVYPWIDMAVFWNWSVSNSTGAVLASKGGMSLSRFLGEGYRDNLNNPHGRSSRPYFYLHLTQTGNPVSPGTNTINPAIRLEPGEVRMFCLADTARRDLITKVGAAGRTWRMKAVQNANDLVGGKNGGIVLDMTKGLAEKDNFTYKLQPGDVVNENSVGFDRNEFFYIMNMADSWQIKNPDTELMVETRPGQGAFPQLPAEKNLVFYGQIHSRPLSKKLDESFQYPSMPFALIKENPQMVGSVLTYHRTALASGMPVADLMFTTNPRQPYVTPFLAGSDSKFQSGPHYESMLQKGSSLTDLRMETTMDGRNAYYGPSHSANGGRSFLPFFEVPRSPTLSLGALQHCDVTATAFGCPSQIGNSWASPYLQVSSVVKRETTSPGGELISPVLGVYDASYLANEALFDDCYFSGAAPTIGSLKSSQGSPSLWDSDQVSETRSVEDLIDGFFKNPTKSPLRNPRMVPYTGSLTPSQVTERLGGPGRCLRLAAHLLYEGGFNINSTSEEAWAAVLSSLRGADPSSGNNTPQSRFSNIITSAPVNMTENNQWSGFRSLSDAEIKTLAKNIVAEIKLRGPFLSLGEFVNRRVSTDRNMNTAGAIQSAIDASGFNRKFTYGSFDKSLFPNPENILTPNTGTNTPGWLSQADVLTALAPSITPRSDTFIIRTLGEAKDSAGKVIATARLEAVVQRVPDWIDPTDDAALPVSELRSSQNKTFGRRFEVISVREIVGSSNGNPI